MKNNNTHAFGLGIGSVLTIIFVVLKLVDVIDWSWWWVVSPALIEIGLDILFGIGFIAYCIKHKRMQNKYHKKLNDMQRGIRHDD